MTATSQTTPLIIPTDLKRRLDVVARQCEMSPAQYIESMLDSWMIHDDSLAAAHRRERRATSYRRPTTPGTPAAPKRRNAGALLAPVDLDGGWF